MEQDTKKNIALLDSQTEWAEMHIPTGVSVKEIITQRPWKECSGQDLLYEWGLSYAY